MSKKSSEGSRSKLYVRKKTVFVSSLLLMYRLLSQETVFNGRGFNESKKTKPNQNKTNVTPEKDNTASAHQKYKARRI